MDTWQPEPRSRGGGAVVARLVLSLLVLGGAYVGLAYWASDHLPASVTVGGIPVGGMTHERALATVERGGVQVLARPVELTLPGRAERLSVVPRDAGLRVDASRSLEGLTGFSLRPAHIWRTLTGSMRLPLMTSADDARLEAYVTALRPTVDRAPHEGSVRFVAGRVSVDLPRDGARLDVPGTVMALRRAFPDVTTAPASVQVLRPAVGVERVRRFAGGAAARVVATPVTLVAGTTKAVVGPTAFGPFVRSEPDGAGDLRLRFDEAGLARLVASRVTVATRPASSARWTSDASHGAPRIVPSVTGLAVDEDAVAKRFVAALTSGVRTVDVRPVATQPAFTTDDARRAGIADVVAEVVLPAPAGDPWRAGVLAAAARRLDGVYVPPGGTASVNGLLGGRDGDEDDVEGTVVVDGRPAGGIVGGASTMSTLVYDLAFSAGAEVLERTPHAYAVPRYPVGRDAVVHWPAVDTRWRNTSAHGMVLQAWVEAGRLHGRLWGTREWQVRVVTGPRRDVVPAATVRSSGSACTARPALPGFAVTVTRQWYRPGAAAPGRSEDVTTRYLPLDGVVCT